MVVGMGEDPNLGEYERLLLSMKTTARKELVLLHPDLSVVSRTLNGLRYEQPGQLIVCF